MKYKRTLPKSIFVIIFVVSIISSLIVLGVPYKIRKGTGLNYWHLFGFGYHNLYALVIFSIAFIIIVLLINMPIFVLAFQKQFTLATIIDMKRMAIFGSVLGILLSAVAMFLASGFFGGSSLDISYTVNVGFPYVYFLFVLVLSAIALSKENIPKLISEIENE